MTHVLNYCPQYNGHRAWLDGQVEAQGILKGDDLKAYVGLCGFKRVCAILDVPEIPEKQGEILADAVFSYHKATARFLQMLAKHRENGYKKLELQTRSNPSDESLDSDLRAAAARLQCNAPLEGGSIIQGEVFSG